MKILSYITKDEKIWIKTDNPNRPDFTYSNDRFNNLTELKAEIEKSIAGEAARKAVKDLKINTLTTELTAEVAK